MFIFGKLGVPRMEVEGAGVGTLIARVFEFSLICGYFLFVDRKIGYRLKDLRMKFVVNKDQRNEKGSRNVTGAACGTSLY